MGNKVQSDVRLTTTGVQVYRLVCMSIRTAAAAAVLMYNALRSAADQAVITKKKKNLYFVRSITAADAETSYDTKFRILRTVGIHCSGAIASVLCFVRVCFITTAVLLRLLYRPPQARASIISDFLMNRMNCKRPPCIAMCDARSSVFLAASCRRCRRTTKWCTGLSRASRREERVII